MSEQYEPVIVGFLCNWCSYRAADLAGTARMHYAPNLRIMRVMCSARVDPQFVLKALSSGADGVMIAGCHPGECHYVDGNMKTLRRFTLLKRVARPAGRGRRARAAGVGLGLRGQRAGRGRGPR